MCVVKKSQILVGYVIMRHVNLVNMTNYVVRLTIPKQNSSHNFSSNLLHLLQNFVHYYYYYYFGDNWNILLQCQKSIQSYQDREHGKLSWVYYRKFLALPTCYHSPQSHPHKLLLSPALFRQYPRRFLAYSRIPSHIICLVYVISHLLLLRVRSLLSTQMVHIVIPWIKAKL